MNMTNTYNNENEIVIGFISLMVICFSSLVAIILDINFLIEYFGYGWDWIKNNRMNNKEFGIAIISSHIFIVIGLFGFFKLFKVRKNSTQK